MLRRMRAPADGWRLDRLEFRGGQRVRLSAGSRRARRSCRCRAAARRAGASPSRPASRRSSSPIATDERADAFRVTGGVRIARVERGRQRADGAQIGRFGFGLGCGDRRQQRVEGGRQLIELAAGAGQRQRFARAIAGGHRRDATATTGRSAAVSVRASQTLPITASSIAPSRPTRGCAAPLRVCACGRRVDRRQREEGDIAQLRQRLDRPRLAASVIVLAPDVAVDLIRGEIAAPPARSPCCARTVPFARIAAWPRDRSASSCA